MCCSVVPPEKIARKASDMAETWVIVPHPYTKVEVRRPSGSEDMADFGHGVKRPGDFDL